MSLPNVLIINLGSQYTLLIERTLRELNVRSVVLEPEKVEKYLEKNLVKAIILSGSGASVYDNNAPKPPKCVFKISIEENVGYSWYRIPILGICYGMQWIANELGGKVTAEPDNCGYGKDIIRVTSDHPLFTGTEHEQEVWVSHGDSVVEVPEEFEVIARSQSGGIAAIAEHDRKVFGVQFHPEVVHTPAGKIILKNFLNLSDCQPDWQPNQIALEIQRRVVGELGSRKAIIGFSGGVDSTTLSRILSPVLGNRLLAVIIDAGHLREGEIDEIRANAKEAGVEWCVINARREFLEALTGIVDAEEKRKQFKKVYTRILVLAAEIFGAHAVIQGTLAPDRIESGDTGGAIIKSHHNVGLDMGQLKQIHPIDDLFKYEVRQLGKELGLSENIWGRQPFPGPGLFIRVVGVPVTSETLEIVRWADARVREVTKIFEVYKTFSQLVVGFVGVNTVGVKGDTRVYGGAIVVRAVETTDFMTVRGVHLPEEIESEISRLLTKHSSIVRVWYDPTDKPPGTTEFE